MSPIGTVSHGARPSGDSRNIPGALLTLGDISPNNGTMPLLDSIAAFIADHGITERKFGEEALNDKNFVADLRAGRSPSLNTAETVQRFMAAYPNHAPFEPRRAKAA